MISSRSPFIAILVLATIVSIANVGYAQPGRGGRGGFMGQGGSMAALLRDSKVQKELELVDDQVEDLEEIQQNMRQEMMDMFRGGGFRDMDDDERRERMDDMRKNVQAKMKEIDEELSDILLPHQFGRLKEIYYQSQVQRGGTAGLADNETLADALGITDEQKEKMKEAAEAASKKLEAKIKDLRKQAQDEVLAVLTSDQRAKLKKLQGDSFEFGNERSRFQRAEGAGRGGGGGRGNRRGRGGNGSDTDGTTSESDN